MRTRRGLCYCAPPGDPACEGLRRTRRRRTENLFDSLHDDLLLSILSKLSASATSPCDLINVLLTCKRFNELAMDPIVLSRASEKCLEIRAERWSESAHKFLKRLADAGNLDACYTLGMIRFYCLGNRGSGAALMARAAMRRHAPALYSLAVIQFNGSGGSKHDRDLRAGAALCFRAASAGHLDALRELGHCLQDGYGVRRSLTVGRRLLLHANALELTNVLKHTDGHAVNWFMVEWFRKGKADGMEEQGLRMCSHERCGRPETRAHEFRRCSVCGVVNYCSRACQALHWRLVHKTECTPMDQWMDVVGDANGAAN